MQVSRIVAQLRTTNLAESISFYTQRMGLTLDFQYQDFYAGIRAGDQVFHLKLVDEQDPSIEYVEHGDHFHLFLGTDDVTAAAEELRRNGVRVVKDVHDTEWGTRECVILDDQGHTLRLAETRKTA
jgi:catechol 2,3-dioxygenase-like lactoylglutathione lyase family enzyme